MTYKGRKRLSLVILLVGLPLYVIAAIGTLALLDRPPIWAEFLVYVVLGIVWAMPFRFVFRGIGQPDPDADNAMEKPAGDDRRA